MQGARGKKEEIKVKICGVTSKEDAILAVGLGADYIGILVEVAISPRSITVTQAKDIIEKCSLPVVVLVYKLPASELENLIAEANPFAVQFVVEEDISLIKALKEKFPKLQLWQSLHVPADGEFSTEEILQTANEYILAGIDVILLDTVVSTGTEKQYGGTGRTSNWDIVKEIIPHIKVPVFLAGGLNLGNVAQAVKMLQPVGVDVSSGVEITKGHKDPLKVEQFIKNARI